MGRGSSLPQGVTQDLLGGGNDTVAAWNYGGGLRIAWGTTVERGQIKLEGQRGIRGEFQAAGTKRDKEELGQLIRQVRDFLSHLGSETNNT